MRGPKKRKATPPMTDMRLKLRFRGGESSAAFGNLEAAHLGRSEDMVSNDGSKENEIMTNDGTDDDNNVEDVPAGVPDITTLRDRLLLETLWIPPLPLAPFSGLWHPFLVSGMHFARVVAVVLRCQYD